VFSASFRNLKAYQKCDPVGMANFSFRLNRKRIEIEAPAGATLLWTLRERLQLTGTKYGCGIAQCGSCTVHLDGGPVRACTTSMAAVEGRSVTTIEGLGNGALHPLQEAWIDTQVPQCGYCQSGQIMQAATLLEKNNRPTRQEIREHMQGVLCRCGTYLRIEKAILEAAQNI
jgi:isoquinoline 1-oxidoreductase alpha subunit